MEIYGHHNSTGEIDDRKSEVIVFVVNAGMNVTANNFKFYF